jgi:hypothetical protein
MIPVNRSRHNPAIMLMSDAKATPIASVVRFFDPTDRRDAQAGTMVR